MVNQVGVEDSRNRARLESYDEESESVTQQPKQQQFMQVPQQFNERYVSPNVVKTDSPTKPGQFAQQPQRPPQQFMNMQPMQPVYNQPPQQSNSFKQPPSTQGYSNQPSKT